MRKMIALLLTVICVVMLAGCCAKSSSEVTIDYGNSSIYSKEDMDSNLILGMAANCIASPMVRMRNAMMKT